MDFDELNRKKKALNVLYHAGLWFFFSGRSFDKDGHPRL